MKRPRLSSALCVSGLFACMSAILLYPQPAAAQAAGIGQTYIITNTDAIGNFLSRGLMTLHPDHTMSVVDSGQGGPTLFFSSQQGTWTLSTIGLGVARTLDFDFAPTNDIARADYNFRFGPNGTITGTITLKTFPLMANPLGGGGTLIGTFNFTGFALTLP